METKSDIDVMYSIKVKLEQISSVASNEDFVNIKKAVDAYLEKHCEHKFINDYIDTTPDSGMSVRYCIHCYKTN